MPSEEPLRPYNRRPKSLAKLKNIIKDGAYYLIIVYCFCFISQQKTSPDRSEDVMWGILSDSFEHSQFFQRAIQSH